MANLHAYFDAVLLSIAERRAEFMLNRNAKCSCDYGAICDACVGPFHSFSVVFSVSSCFCCCSCSSSGRIHFVFSVSVCMRWQPVYILFVFIFIFFVCAFLFFVRCVYFPIAPPHFFPVHVAKFWKRLCRCMLAFFYSGYHHRMLLYIQANVVCMSYTHIFTHTFAHYIFQCCF